MSGHIEFDSSNIFATKLNQNGIADRNLQRDRAQWISFTVVVMNLYIAFINDP